MAPLEQLRVLSGRLARELDAALLDRPLDALDGLVEGEARLLLQHGFEAGVARSLRELIAGDRLLAWIEETCTEREAELIGAALQRLLGGGSDVGPDDPARLVQVEPPPADERELRAWAQRYDVLHELMRPARELLSGLGAGSEATLAACALGAAGGEPRSLLVSSELRAEAARYLTREARHNAAQPARERLWEAPPPAALRRLVERLRALLEGRAPAALHALRFSPARPLSIDEQSGLCEARLLAEAGSEAIAVQLYLAGFEQRALHAACRLCSGQPCLHVQALAGRLLDACLDRDDRLHAPLVRFVARPSWELFFAAAQGTQPRRAQAERERLAFVLRLTGDLLSIGALLQTRGSDGGYSSGRLIAPARALFHASCSDQDRVLLDLLAPKTRTLSPGFVPADLALLRALCEHPHVSMQGAHTALAVLEETLEVRVLEQADGLRPEVRLGETAVRAGARDRSASYLLAYDEPTAQLRFAPLTPALKRLLVALERFRGVLPRESYPRLATYLASLDKVARVHSPRVLLGLERPTPKRFLLQLAPLPEQGVELALSMRPFALSGLWPPGKGPELVHGLSEGQQAHVRRDLTWEAEAAHALLAALGVDDAIRVEPFRYRVESTQAALELLARAARLGERLEIEWAERAAKLHVCTRLGSGDLKVALFKRGAFFFPEGSARNAHAELAFVRLLEAARRNERFVRVAGGDFVELERELFERLQNAQLCVLDAGPGLKLSTAAAPFWLAQLPDVCAGGDAESQAMLARASEFCSRADGRASTFCARAHGRASTPGPDVSLPAALSAELRSYQREGVRFLLACASFAPGALLADEMGLGKTVQSIALLAGRASQGAALVVCPTSLVDNWWSELTRFAPELRAVRYRGPKRRDELPTLGAGDVLLISYELLTRDRGHFEGLAFATQIVDEAQVVKNARTRRARAVASIDAGFRVALSGTPVENRLGDLWSVFHLIAPGLLGSWPRFRARFAVPIERYDNRERAAALQQLVRPLLLRRRKLDVEAELPPRTEVVHLVALSQAERDLYQSALAEARRAIGRRRADDPGLRLHVLAELTRLRQLACHPRLVIDDARVESSKLAALTILLNDLLPRGHRVLIFSQFVAHLALVREELARRAIVCAWLSGSTPASERAELVRRFQAGEAQVFLISLKAGGTGLNLTAADYVVHMDPWWNPSAEDQASDRAHRIGQGRPVTVVKLVAQDTIEERVLALHEHKRRLAALVLGPAAAAPSERSGEAYAELLL
jgi:superfamily II DNA or RNA helicase